VGTVSTALALRRLGAPILHWDRELDDPVLAAYMTATGPDYHDVRSFKYDYPAYHLVPRREIKWALVRLTPEYTDQLVRDTRQSAEVLPRIVELAFRVARARAEDLPRLRADAALLVDRIGDARWTKLLRAAHERADYRRAMPRSVAKILSDLRHHYPDFLE
jgi:hypothetical protein